MKNQVQIVTKTDHTTHNEFTQSKLPTNFRGMTLKEYFRLSQANSAYDNCQIKQTDQQNLCSSNQGQTPSFNKKAPRQKIKTQVCEDKSFCEDRPIFLSKQKNSHKHPLKDEAKTKFLRLKKNQIELLPTPLIPKKSKNQRNSKRVSTLGSTSQKQHFNRSTITSFYQLESKKKKMLEKIKHQKQRVNQMKLSDAFFITKYAQKFHLNDKKSHKNPL